MDVGSIIGGTYRLEARIGRGGMGMVFRASHSRLPGKQVAIKVLHADVASEEMLARFKREAEIVSRLAHPNIVGVEDFNVTEDGTPYLVLEYLDGESLAQRLARGRVSVEHALAIARQVGAALAAAHARGIVHRDLKPQNVFLVRGEVAKVLDFGISKLLDSQTVKTDDDALLGTPQYMAPEQATGRHAAIDTRTDVFSLGVLVHEMVSGRPAFTGSSIPEIVYKVVHEDPEPLPPELPEAIASAIRRAMAKSADERFSSVNAFIEALTGERLANTPPDDALAQTLDSRKQLPEPVAAAPPTIPTPRAATRGFRAGVIVACVAAASAVTAGVMYLALRGGGGDQLDHDRMRAVAAQLLTGTEVTLDGKQYAIEQVGRTHLKAVKFKIDGHAYEAFEQNLDKQSRWAELARQGHKVVHFRDLATNAYVAVVVDGEVSEHGDPK